MPGPASVVLPGVRTVNIRLDAVQSIIHDMVLMAQSEELSGLNPWIYETYSALTREQQQTHQAILIGLHYTVLPTRLWKDFPAYLAHLENCDPLVLRDSVLEFYLDFHPCVEAEKQLVADKDTLLADRDFFLEYLRTKFGEELVNPKIETQAFRLLNNPAEMQKTISSHLRFLWENFFRAEWKRITPMLEDSVMAFDKVDFNSMSREEAARYITGQELNPEHWDLNAEDIKQLIFVPSAHVGPYLGKFQYKNALGVIFGARLPQDTEMHAPDLSRNEITIRLSALADDIRLRILKLIAEDGELRSQEIMDRLDLSQSAASRHLKQLSATGYLVERRCSGAKCYALNTERIQDTLQAVAAFLLCD